MEFHSILDREDSSYSERVTKPAYFLDLNLNPLIEQIQFQWSQDIAPYFRYFPENAGCEEYRRAVYQDVKKEEIHQALMDYAEEMKRLKKARSNKQEVVHGLQISVWHLWEVYHYGHAFRTLHERLQELQPASEGFRLLQEYLSDYLSQPAFTEMWQQAEELMKALTNISLVLTMENDQVTITQEELPCSYEAFLEESFPEKKKTLRSPFIGNLQLSSLEEEIIRLLQKKQPDFFKKVDRFYLNYLDYAQETLMRFDEEIGFYLSFSLFQRKMERLGYAFCMPKVEENKDMCAAGLYDLALACANSKRNLEVVSNDMSYHAGERFFVVTGPNQGGKTTFARSLGQLIYFTKLGLDVPAESANVHYFSDLLTHFSVEESVETGRGKLKEELDRLAPMMGAAFDSAFVIINELFTTAANYDACIMGKRVLEHFLKRQCKGIYVTHLKELSEGDERIVSIRALVEEVKDTGEDGRVRVHNVRRFKMLRSAAEDIGYASDLVDKYQLNYEQLRERLSIGQEV